MPPKSSLPATMPPSLVEVSHANGVSRFTRKKLAALLAAGGPEEFGMHPIVPTRRGKAPYPFPGIQSALSEDYGYVVRDAQRSIALSADEMRRYLLGQQSRAEQDAIKKAEAPDLGLRVEIAHNDDLEIMDPNGAAALFLSGDCFVRQMEPIKLQEDGDETLQSAISGEPALVYRAGTLEIPLTLEEMQRLVAHALKPEDWARLQVIYGDFYEIGPHFYDPATGEALQPALEEDELGPHQGGPRP
jgi:hypothetical protein